MTKRTVNRRITQLGHSEIRAMTQACAQLKGLNMAQGVCDTAVPAIVLQAAASAIDRGDNVYSRFDGLPQLRQALAVKLLRDNGIHADPETDITVSAGATGAFHAACLALLNPGDEVILFEPYYQYHISTLLAVEAVPVIVKMASPEWSLSLDAVEQAVTKNTKALIVNSPGNPSGKVFSVQEMAGVGEIARRHDLFVFTDEIYEYFLYDGRRHVSMASLPDMAERTITIGGYSKTFSITGWRIGYSVATAQWARAIGAMNDLLYVCAPTPLQAGVASGIQALPPSFYHQLAKDYEAKRDRFCATLAQAGLRPSIPDGAYYVLADAARLPGTTGKERAMHLLERTGVAGVPGEAFFAGQEGSRYLRFSYAKTDADLDEACRRLSTLA
ncbi:pyridoxal phosphate-dependent aminotransferase [Nitrospira sp. KM1]|uniref:pyridoxal phosphate-dependent aminotransferase n=1 Tax=Nitrospira sp. KM1 TaxID=1936990 RepID=UPI001E41EBA3|nr:aminotransferase class I/II-fold pyridoxal phosphate-dependent enzyme [Nitrospira sp. KM1]